MAEVECTAGEGSWRDPRRLLVEPDCSCPRCAPEPVDEPAPRRQWLHMSGSAQRLHIEPVALGTVGHELLG